MLDRIALPLVGGRPMITSLHLLRERVLLVVQGSVVVTVRVRLEHQARDDLDQLDSGLGIDVDLLESRPDFTQDFLVVWWINAHCISVAFRASWTSRTSPWTMYSCLPCMTIFVAAGKSSPVAARNAGLKCSRQSTRFGLTATGVRSSALRHHLVKRT